MKASIEKLNIIIEKSLIFLEAKTSYVAVFLISASEMRKLNRMYRGKDKPTNVLAFPFPEDFPSPKPGKKRFLGEIYLSPRYIKDHGENLEYMLIHGLLHLLGFNHIKKNDRMTMQRLERSLMETISNN